MQFLGLNLFEIGKFQKDLNNFINPPFSYELYNNTLIFDIHLGARF